MSSGIRFTGTEMRYIALFESITGANVKDCILDEDASRIIFVVKEGEIGVAIGKNGKNAERIRFLAKRYFQIQNVSIT